TLCLNWPSPSRSSVFMTTPSSIVPVLTKISSLPIDRISPLMRSPMESFFSVPPKDASNIFANSSAPVFWLESSSSNRSRGSRAIAALVSKLVQGAGNVAAFVAECTQSLERSDVSLRRAMRDTLLAEQGGLHGAKRTEKRSGDATKRNSQRAQ